MKKTQTLNAKIEELQKIARGLESGDIMPNNESNGSPEDVMELVEEAVELLEEVKEITPAEESHEMAGDRIPEVDSLIAKVKQAIDGDDDDDKKDDDDDDDKEKDAKTKIAETQGDQQDDDDEEVDFKKEARKDRTRLAFLEQELESRKRIAIAESAAELYPESIRNAEVEKLTNSKGSNRALEAKIKFAKDVVEKQNVQKTAYRKVTESQGGYLTRKAKQVIVPAWRT
jgi:hypothetical protein